MPTCPNDKTEAGLSLVELLIALSIFALTASITSAALKSAIPKKRVHNASVEVTQYFAQARGLAMSRGSPIIVSIENNKLSTNSDLKPLLVHRKVQISPQHAELVIYEDGSANGLTVHLSAAKFIREVTVEKFTGRILRHE